MLSHLRFHRRAPSNPTSPLHDQHGPWEPSASQDHPANLRDVSQLSTDNRPRSSNSSQQPPTLPPIARVTSSELEPIFDLRDDARPASPEDYRSPPASRPALHGGASSSFIGGVALKNYQRDAQGAQRQEPAANNPPRVPDSRLTRAKPPPPPINTSVGYRPSAVPTQAAPGKASKSTSFITPTDLQNSSATGRRPAGTRLASEPPPLPSTAANPPEAHRARKGLPFLKNPMSTLLMRRRTGQNVPDFLPATQETEPTYDPRIKGTRVHDFSAPRPRKILSSGDVITVAAAGSPDPVEAAVQGAAIDEDRSSPLGVSRETSTTSVQQSIAPSVHYALPKDAKERKRLSLDKPLPKQPAEVEEVLPGSAPGDIDPSSPSEARPSAAGPSRANSVATLSMLKSNPSTSTTRSRRISARESVLSAVPRHMKSTSSRFSFDMIGAAEQERLLEERHRQRQAEKAVSNPRDSTFDEYDEDFDYDAMMDDDGLEERIPGVNADYEDDDEMYEEDLGADMEEEEKEEDPEAEMDPDDDQENFAGFVFQRSNPTSSVASPRTPGMLATPRDATGRVIGFALTKDTTPDLGLVPSPLYVADPNLSSKRQDSPSGLGIHGFEAPETETIRDETPTGQRNNHARSTAFGDDDIYFDDGLADELEFEHDGTTFDESIFDNNDTDQYGRPIPGAFAHAQSERAAKLEASRRASDMTSRLSAQSGMSDSTTHTSLSADARTSTALEGKETAVEKGSASQVPDPVSRIPTALPGPDLAYQAALAEAAQQAAASGKFIRRSSSPQLPADVTITSPTDSSGSNSHSNLENSLDHYEDDMNSNDGGMDDYDFDDDAIIAEANASALANDSDGWYGQEFGFFAAPVQAPHHGYAPSSKGANGLKAEEPYSFGGYFSGSGASVNRSSSGRIVSREPNLTPITERSEYSNRNSIMSLISPPGIGAEARNSASIQSPGLAQLAMMADDDNISLSALLKLRSRAWGGSQASLASSREGSPRSERGTGPGESQSSLWGAGPNSHGPPGTGRHSRKNSTFSLWSNSDAGSACGSPTLTMAMPLPVSSPPAPVPPLPASSAGPIVPLPLFSPSSSNAPNPPPNGLGSHPFPAALDNEPVYIDEEEELAASGERPDSSAADSVATSTNGAELKEPLSPSVSASSSIHRHGRRSGMGHRHKGSADSISYRKEEESGSWVMERRRTGETGEVEILESEVLEGGRI